MTWPGILLMIILDREVMPAASDGTEERVPIVGEPPKKKRLSAKIAWYWDLKTGQRKFY